MSNIPVLNDFSTFQVQKALCLSPLCLRVVTEGMTIHFKYVLHAVNKADNTELSGCGVSVLLTM